MANRKIGGSWKPSEEQKNALRNQRSSKSSGMRSNTGKPQGGKSGGGGKKVDMDFVNPYNFIKSDLEKTSKYPVKNSEKEISGYIECKLIARTPLLIPDYIDYDKVPEKERGEAHKDHKFADFMNVINESGEKKYFIPGSSLRGLVRNVYETITDSCFSTLNNSKMLSARTTCVSKPGLLVKEGEMWCLYEAEEYNIDNIKVPKITDADSKIKINISGTDYFSGEAVEFHNVDTRDRGRKFIKPSDIKKCETSEVLLNKDDKKGFLVIGSEPIIGKGVHHNKIFTFKGTKATDEFEEKSEYWLSLVNTINSYRDERSNQKLGAGGHHGHRQFEKNKEDGVIPVWINKGKSHREEDSYKGKYFYLQPTCIGRRTYYKTYEKLIKEKKPCELRRKGDNWETTEQLCPACKLFGTVKEGALGSRVRITDAEMINGKVREKYKTLSILSSPKPTFLPFYADFTDDGKMSFEGYDSEQVSIKGRKFYLHSCKFEELNKDKDIDKSNQNVSTKPTEKGSEFTFKIFFDNVTKDELSKLIWVITLGENDANGRYCHKIGHGKPIGMGSVKIIAERVVERSYATNKYTEQKTEKDNIKISLGDSYLAEKDTINELLKISDFEIAEKLDKVKGIHYPPGGYEWFTKDSKIGKTIAPLLSKYSDILRESNIK